MVLLALLFSQLGVSPVTARTKQEAVQDFITSLDTGFGYKETPTDQESRVTSTTRVLMLAPLIDYKIKEKQKLFHFYQAHQNNDSGFADLEGQPSDLETSMLALLGLQKLGYNYTTILRWDALTYINQTLTESLLEPRFDPTLNQTILQYQDTYPPRTFTLLSTFLQVAAVYNYKWSGNLTHLITIAINYQFKNGSYSSIDHATAALTFLSLVGVQPIDIAGAIDYLLAFQSATGGFSPIVNKTGDLKTTWEILTALTLLNVDLEKQLLYYEKTIKFILDLQDQSGGFKDTRGVSVLSTYYALQCLLYLNSLDELLQKELLQAVGYLDTSLQPLLLTGILFAITKQLLPLTNKSRARQKQART